MKRKVLLIPLALLLTISLVAIGCPSPAPEEEVPTPPPEEEEPTPPPAEEEAPPEVIELDFAHITPAVVPMAQLHQQWGDMIEEQSGGRVKFTFYWGGSLLKDVGGEMKRGVQSGIADIGYHGLNPLYGWELSAILNVPMMGCESMAHGTRVSQELLNKYPELQAEFGGLKWYSPRLMPAYMIHTTDKPIHVPADMKGMKIYAVGEMAKLEESMGGTAVGMSVTDWYLSLETGVLDGLCMHWPGMDAFGCTELVPYHTILGFHYLLDSFFINPDTWNSLPPDIQQIFNDLEPWLTEEEIKVDVADEERVMNKAEGLGHTFIYLTPEETQLWTEAALPFHEEWIAAHEAMGPAREIYEEAKRLLAEYSESE